MKLQLENFQKDLIKTIEPYTFEVGILTDKPHFEPMDKPSLFADPPTKNYAGGPARKVKREVGPLSTGEILVENMKRLKKNILLEPFERQNSKIIQFTKAFFQMALAKGSTKRVENLLQAVVRNPILKGEYGPNTNATQEIKGFDRALIDTAQMFKAIKAKVIKRRV